jgi:galactokinase
LVTRVRASPIGQEVLSEFTRLFGGQPRMFRAPGRINIIGEHLDYNGGAVVPTTVDLFTWAAASPRDDRLLDVLLWNHGSRHRLDLDALRPDGSGEVTEYLKGVAWALQEDGIEAAGCNLVIGGDIPLGGGLSSSASLEVVLARALAERAGASPDGRRLARLCHRAEAEFVGVRCGIMDQYAVALGRGGQAMVLDCARATFEFCPLPAAAAFLVTHSGVSHRLPAGSYNTRREECSGALALLREACPGLGHLAELTPDQLESNRLRLGETLFRRCRHVVSENGRVGQARRALLEDDVERLGALMDASHRSLRDDYEVSCAEVDALVDIARACDGVLGSRIMGGGFGGCALSLVRPEAMQDAVRHITREYGALLGREPWMHVVDAPERDVVPGAAAGGPR